MALSQGNNNVIIECQFSDSQDTTQVVSEEMMLFLLGLQTRAKQYQHQVTPISMQEEQLVPKYKKLPPKQPYQQILNKRKLKKLNVQPANKDKLEKIAIYSKCQTRNCKCRGWIKTHSSDINHISDPCKCKHSMENHLRQMRNGSEEDLNRIFQMVLDVENMFLLIMETEELYVSKIYTYLIKLVGNCILTLEKPAIKITGLQPPFETPSIELAITCLKQTKFDHLTQEESDRMHEMAEIFLHCLNIWHLPFPGNFKKENLVLEKDRSYTANYIRWFVFCHVPVYFESFERYYTTKVFGIGLLRVVLKPFADQLQQVGVRLSPKRRTIFEQYFPTFLSALEKEVYSTDSDIWGTDKFETCLKRKNGLLDWIRESPSFCKT